MDSKDPNVEFFNYLNTQTTKMLAALTNEQSQPDFTNFSQPKKLSFHYKKI